MLKNSQRKTVLWIALCLVFAAGAVSLFVLAVKSWPGSDDEGGSSGSAPSTSWYTTRPPQPTMAPTDPGQGGTSEPSGPSEPPSPAPVVTKTVISVPENGGGDGGDGPTTLISACGSLLSGAAAVGTLLHAINISRQNNRSAAATDEP
ncbi:hypothetical protein [Streptomyces sp. HD]|uniref:hypothetical protein n=1 Tax=Streptomyces sp. HD TaxID=3020892 RepID=UPI00232FA6F1|nr:hypothetical protein [Streptomyces sp. HD]MDC0770211.1 hypothetical protein [Streptomyces sp. HD]